MLSSMTTSKKDIIKIEKEEFIQDIIPVTYQVDYKSLEHREAFDFSEVQYNPIPDSYKFRERQDQIIICVSVDGSVHSDYCIDLLNEDFMPMLNKDKQGNAKYLCVYVYFSTKNKDFNYSNSKNRIIENVTEKLGKVKRFNGFYIEDRWTKKHSLHQVMIHANNNTSDYFFVGFFGFKGPKGENLELTKGINYLLGYSQSPTVIIKEKIHRKDTKTGGFNWLIVLERNYFGRIKTLEVFLNLIDKEKDNIYGIGLFENVVPSFDPIEKEFINYCEKNGLKNYSYEATFYKNYVSEVISDKVNHGILNFNYMCFMNNVLKHHKNPNENDYAELLKKCSCNICFINISSS